MKVTAIICALATAGSASAGQAEFFYDLKCKQHAGYVNVNSNDWDPNAVTGGPWGSRSVMFRSTSGLKYWSVASSPPNNPKHRVWKPLIGQCTYYSGGVYVSGSNSLAVHKKRDAEAEADAEPAPAAEAEAEAYHEVHY
ncbi:hypothetical protein MMC25_003276 [Agyrium rufum]|nr:hypothetical protein [Agyrium rufum]